MLTPHSGTITENNQPISEIIPLDGEIGIEKTMFSISCFSQIIHYHGDLLKEKLLIMLLSYPVIIQIYDEDGEAFHFAQTDVEEDGSYEYKFRVRNVT